MANGSGFFRNAPLEVEYRTGGNQLGAVASHLGKEIVIPKSIYVRDSYLYFHPPTGDLRRVREVRTYERDGPRNYSEPKHQEQWKLHPYGEHPVEWKRQLSQDKYMGILRKCLPTLVVEGSRDEIWVTPNGDVSLNKVEGALHITFDSPAGLGDWTEFEIEVEGLDGMDEVERIGRELEARDRIFEFTDSLRIQRSDLNHPTYVEMILKNK